MKNSAQSLREEQHLTQTELSEKSGISLRTIQRIEAGKELKGYTLKALASALNVQPEDLIEKSEVDISRAKLINLSCLSYLIIPFGNIIIPVLLTYRSVNKEARELGKNIVSVQILWSLALCVLMAISPLLQSLYDIKPPFFVIFLLIMFAINFFIILKNASSLSDVSVLSVRLKKQLF